MDRLSILYVISFRFLYSWEEEFLFKFISINIIVYMILSDLTYWAVRSHYTSKVRNNKIKLFQEQFQELYHFIDKKLEDSIRRDFFRSPLYKFYSKKDQKKFPWNFIQVIECKKRKFKSNLLY